MSGAELMAQPEKKLHNLRTEIVRYCYKELSADVPDRNTYTNKRESDHAQRTYIRSP